MRKGYLAKLNSYLNKKKQIEGTKNVCLFSLTLTLNNHVRVRYLHSV